MGLEIKVEPLPLVIRGRRGARGGGTRVTLDTVIAASRDGATAEEIVNQFPTLQASGRLLGDRLLSPEELDGYLGKRQELARRTRKENEARFDPQGLRDRLMARRGKDR